MALRESDPGADSRRGHPFRLTKAEWMADTLQRDLEQGGLIAGERIGTKADLRARYDVASGTVSQALLMLKSRGLVEIRPGAHGGIFVADAGSQQLDDVILGFRWNDATFEQCREVRSALEPVIAVQAARHRTQDDIRDLRTILADMERSVELPSDYMAGNFALHRRIAAIGTNRLLKAMYVTINDFFERRFVRGADDSDACRADLSVHLVLVAAIEAGDEPAVLAAAARHERNMLQREAARKWSPAPARKAEPSDQRRFRDAFPATSYGAAIARQLEREMSGGTLLPGERIGTRDELRRRFDVSVGTIDEAVRLAVARGLIVSRSGPGGGLFMAAASTRIERSTLFADYAGEQADTQDFIDLRDALEPLVCRAAASHCAVEDANALRVLLNRMRDAFDQPEAYMIQNWNLHRRISQCVQNPPLHSMYLVVLDALEATLASVAYERGVVEQHLSVHAELVDAIVAGNHRGLEHALRLHAAGPMLATHSLPTARRGRPAVPDSTRG